jgi:hypothetical protein
MLFWTTSANSPFFGRLRPAELACISKELIIKSLCGYVYSILNETALLTANVAQQPEDQEENDDC